MHRRHRPTAHRWAALVLTGTTLLAGCGGSPEPTAEPTAEESAQPSSQASARPSASASPDSGAAKVEDGEEYVDEAAGFAITFPADWRLLTDQPGVEVRALPPQPESGFADNVTVLIEDTGMADSTLEDYLDRSLTSAPKNIDDFQLVRREVDGDLGLFEFTGLAGDQPLHVLASVFVVEGKAYFASLTASGETYDDVSEQAEQVLRTLRPA